MRQNANDYKFRCSSLGKIMTNGNSILTEKQTLDLVELQSKKDKIYEKLTNAQSERLEKLIQKRDNPELSSTCTTHLIEVFIREEYGRRREFTNKYVEKGLKVEEDSLDLYSKIKGIYLEKNEEDFSNDFITGTPDIVLADAIIDIKSSYDIFTFFETQFKDLKSIYYWQIQGYLWLTGRAKGRVVYCLVDTPNEIINDEKRRLQWKMNVIDDIDPDFQKACENIELVGSYADIPINRRYFEIDVIKDPLAGEKIAKRVAECRNWINENFY